ncbi:hypothetical protein J8L70_06295 [Pseudoalteromonas sp. MMG010]|uniref:hypothetical protein n=1 Tax=Pseudoalteromonas sp. MMG010 TaxID=2822685 RepID=UPI001B3A6629|nr:hypothetical protein [Pseudoalteromonas sp. MMG010]MBQ4832845.1 hypothetical protein [Pseudoalteromonas sp. MMG010]
MPFEVSNYLLLDTDSKFSHDFATHYFDQSKRQNPSTLIVAGGNTRQLVKMMFDNLIKDYSYCDISNEISVSELASYLHTHHQIKGVLLNKADYLSASKEQQFIFNSIHQIRFLVSQSENGYYFESVGEKGHVNHLSCQTEIAQTSADLTELAIQLNKI